MHVKANQASTFAEPLIDIPNSQLDTINKIIDWNALTKDFIFIRTDYNAMSLFKALLIGTWHNLSDKSLADSLKRDGVFMNFCGFSISDNKPDATTLLRFSNPLIKHLLLNKLLTVINQQNSKALKSQNPRDGMMRKRPQGESMSHWDQLRNKAISTRRFVVEKTFGTLKSTYGMARSRYIGLEQVANEVNLKAIAYNLTRSTNVYKNLITT